MKPTLYHPWTSSKLLLVQYNLIVYTVVYAKYLRVPEPCPRALELIKILSIRCGNHGTPIKSETESVSNVQNNINITLRKRYVRYKWISYEQSKTLILLSNCSTEIIIIWLPCMQAGAVTKFSAILVCYTIMTYFAVNMAYTPIIIHHVF